MRLSAAGVLAFLRSDGSGSGSGSEVGISAGGAILFYLAGYA